MHEILTYLENNTAGLAAVGAASNVLFLAVLRILPNSHLERMIAVLRKLCESK